MNGLKMFSYTAGSSTGVYVKTIVDGFFHFFGSVGASATRSPFASQYIVSSSPRSLHASAASTDGDAADAASASAARIETRGRDMESPRCAGRPAGPVGARPRLSRGVVVDRRPSYTRSQGAQPRRGARMPRRMRGFRVRARPCPPRPSTSIVMAAGQGKRMRSARPKVLHPIAGRPMLAHVLDAARAIAPVAIAVVVGHGGDEVDRALGAPGLAFVRQDPPRGTGDAVRVALAALPRDGVTVVINGDTPLIPGPLLHALAERAARGHLALLTAHTPDPAGLGRIVRDGAGGVRRIVEDRDASRVRARDRRDLHRRARGADRAARGVGREARAAQRAERVLPDRRRGGRGRRRRRRRRGDRARRARHARHQRPRAARRASSASCSGDSPRR